MITEDYCSFELSKLLEEKGFDVELQCYSYDAVTKENVDIYWQKNINGLLPRCTHQMAMKWLREVHRKYIDIRYNNQNEEYRFIVFTMVKDKPIDFIHSEYYDTYEEAIEAALKYTLENLI